MKIKILVTLLASALLGSSAICADDETPLAKQMSEMNKSLRMLKRQLPDATKKADNLALLEKIKVNLDEGHKQEPAKTKDVPAGEKAAYIEKYKTQMIELGKAFGELEAAIKVDKPDEAKAALDKISELKEKGHKDFAPEDDK